MKFISTRGGEKVSAAQTIVAGLSANGGLYVPEKFPAVPREELEEMLGMSYPERAAKVLGKYLSEYDSKELLKACEDAYSRFEGGDPAPLVRLDDGVYMLELWHGPTCAFKDMALTMLPHLLSSARKKTGETAKTLILVATSGDTGKAALEAFRGQDGFKIAVVYPKDGVSKIQELQMNSTRDMCRKIHTEKQADPLRSSFQEIFCLYTHKCTMRSNRDIRMEQGKSGFWKIYIMLRQKMYTAL